MMGKCAIIGAECPRTSSPEARRFCPLWTDGVAWTNTRTGQEVVENCGARMLIPAMLEVVKASNRPAAEIGAMRSTIAHGLARIATATSKGNGLGAIEHGEDRARLDAPR